HEQLRLAEQRGRDAKPLAHPLRVAPDPVVRAAEQVDQLEELVDPAAGAAPVERREQLEVLAAAQIAVEVRRLDEPGDAVERLRQLTLRIPPEQERAPGRRAA